jgi:hypothetical protein
VTIESAAESKPSMSPRTPISVACMPLPIMISAMPNNSAQTPPRT